MPQKWETDMNTSEKLDWLKLNLDQNIAGLARDITTTVRENKKLYMSNDLITPIQNAFDLQDENLRNIRNWIKNKFPDDIDTIEYKTLADDIQEQGMVANTSKAAPVANVVEKRAVTARAREEAEQASLSGKEDEAARNAEIPPATQALPGIFGWFKTTPKATRGGRSGYKKQKASSKRIMSKRITTKRRR